MSDLDLAKFVLDGVFSVTHGRVFDDAVVTRGDDDHLGWGKQDDFLMVLASKGLGANLHSYSKRGNQK